MTTQKSGIEILRSAVALFDGTNESFNQRYTAEQLLVLADCQRRSGWDFYPHQWAARQVTEALTCNIPPQWDDNERPVYTPRKTKASK